MRCYSLLKKLQAKKVSNELVPTCCQNYVKECVDGGCHNIINTKPFFQKQCKVCNADFSKLVSNVAMLCEWPGLP